MTGKKRKLINARNIAIIVISIIMAIASIVLSFVFDLYGYLGTIGGIVINALIFFGVFGALEIDDWTIWIKRWLIKRYNKKQGNLIIKVYNDELKKTWLEIPFSPLSYTVTNDQTIVWDLILENAISLHCSINPITNGVTITDAYGATYKCGKEQYTRNNKRLDVELDTFNVWLKNKYASNTTSFNPDSLTIELK